MQAAAVVGGEETAGAVGAGANAMVAAPAGHFLERIAVGPFGVGPGFPKPSRDVAADIHVALGTGNQHLPAPATPAALCAGEALFGIDAKGKGHAGGSLRFNDFKFKDELEVEVTELR